MLNKLLQILTLISKVIATQAHKQNTLAKIVDILADKLDVDVCSVYIYDEETQMLVLAATHGLRQDSIGKIKMRVGEGLTGVSFKRRKIINIAHPSSHKDFKPFMASGEEKFNSYLSIPLTISGHCLGIMVIQDKLPKPFDNAIVDMVKSLSSQLANLILNRRLLNDLAKSTNEEASQVSSEHGEKKQIRLRGHSANSGVVKGITVVFQRQNYFDSILCTTADDVQKEVELLAEALEYTKQQVLELEQHALTLISEVDAAIFNAHLLFLEDPSIAGGIKKEIEKTHYSAEYCVKLVFKKLENKFSKLGSSMFQERIMDLKDILLRLSENIIHLRQGGIVKEKTCFNEKEIILIAEELLPSDLIRLPISDIKGIVCEKGGVTAHISILAKALNIPILLGVSNVLNYARNGMLAILDCHAENVYLNPSEDIIENFKKIASHDTVAKDDVCELPALTRDKQEITLQANISLLCELPLVDKYRAEGIGLYRTEFLYMVRDNLPSEDDQFNVFSKVLSHSSEYPITVRILDVGADKPIPYLDTLREENPALGNRGIRFLLSNKTVLKTHLKAILRANQYGNLVLLIPMVSNVQEIREVKALLEESKQELMESEITFSPKYKLGVMLEVPSLLWELEALQREVDYISIGSNDLLQYTFAVDRTNELISDAFSPFHPTFLKLLYQIGKNIDKTPLAICGEFASNPLATPLLIGAKIYSLSMVPQKIPVIKEVIAKYTIQECEQLLQKALTLSSHTEVIELIESGRG